METSDTADKEPAIMVGEPDATTQPTPQDNQLMSKHRVLSLQSQLRLERRGQDGQNETEQPDHSASLDDSITSATWMRFSVHTPGSPHEQRPLVLRPALSLVPVDPSGSHDYSTRNAGGLASGRLSPLLALEIVSTGRATADRDRIARADPADERREFALGCAAHPRRTAQARV